MPELRHRRVHGLTFLSFITYAALSLGLGTSVGCGSMSSSTPDSSTLYIGHRVGVGRVAGASPTEVSVSTRMYADLELFEPSTLEGGGYARGADEIAPAIIQSALSSDETVVRIDSFRGSYAKVEGLRPGTAEVSFVTDRGRRTFEVHVAEPVQVVLRHYVWGLAGEDADVAFSMNGIARFAMTRRDMAHRILGGYGAALPLHVDPPRAARISIRDGDVEHVDIHLEEATETVTLRPLGGDPVTFSIIAPSADDQWGVSTIDPEEGETELQPLAIDHPALVTIWSRTAGGTRLLGVMGRATLVSVTPDVCEAESDEDVHGDGVFRLRRLTEGECRLEVQVGDNAVMVSVPIGNESLALPEATVGAQEDGEGGADGDS